MDTHSYRIYLMNEAGRVRQRVDLGERSDDDAAIAELWSLRLAPPLELWDRGRLVARLKDSPPHGRPREA